MEREFKVGDKVIRIAGRYEGERGTITHIPKHSPNESPYTIWIQFDNPDVHGGNIYRGHSTYAELICSMLPEDSESIEA